MSVGWTMVALAIPTVVALVCIVVADGRQDPTAETWDNGMVTYVSGPTFERVGNFHTDAVLDTSQVERG